MPNSVKFFDSTMLGAPVLSGEVGTLVALLDSCLVNGFVAVSVSSVVVAASVATVTTATAHGFAMAGLTGPVVLIAGATPAGLNAEWRIASVTNTTVFTFACPGVTAGTATGTITVKRAGAGWTKAFSGTNQAAYLMDQVGGNPHYLQVIDDAAVTTAANGRWAKWTGYEAMTSVTAGTNPFPTVAQSATGLQVLKSGTSDATARWWWFVADGQLFYFGSGWHATTYAGNVGGYAFGKTGSLREADAYDTLISAETAGALTLPTSPGTTNVFSAVGAYSVAHAGRYLARSHTQLGTAVQAGFVAAPGPCVTMGLTGFAYPYALNNGLFISAPGLAESSLIRQTQMPGLYYPQHPNELVHGDAIDNIAGLLGKTLRCQALVAGNASAQCLIDITGPWVR